MMRIFNFPSTQTKMKCQAYFSVPGFNLTRRNISRYHLLRKSCRKTTRYVQLMRNFLSELNINLSCWTIFKKAWLALTCSMVVLNY